MDKENVTGIRTENSTHSTANII